MPALQVQVWLWRVSLRQLWSSSGGHEHTGRRGCAALLGAAVVAGLAAVLAQVGLAGVDGVLPVTVVLASETGTTAARSWVSVKGPVTATDAAMLTAKGHGNLAFDLSKREQSSQSAS